MPHVLAPRPGDSGLPIFFNVDASVGRNGANSNRDDILLVQFLLKVLSVNMTTPQGLAIQPLLAATPQTGVMDPATMASIHAYQNSQTGINRITADGRISTAHGYRHGGGYYTIVVLNAQVKDDFLAQWPRLDHMPGGAGMSSMMARLL